MITRREASQLEQEANVRVLVHMAKVRRGAQLHVPISVVQILGLQPQLRGDQWALVSALSWFDRLHSSVGGSCCHARQRCRRALLELRTDLPPQLASSDLRVQHEREALERCTRFCVRTGRRRSWRA